MAVAKAAEVLGASFLDIKGVSVLATSLDLVNSIPEDYMHAGLYNYCFRLGLTLRTIIV